MSSIRPSQVRTRILREHDALGARIEELAALVSQLNAGQSGAWAAVLEAAQSLHSELREHIDFEDEVLAPALRQSDSWGPLRADQLIRHHAQQRAELRELGVRCTREDAAGLADLVTAMIVELRLDIAHENRDFLHADLLRDDVISDGEAG